MNQRLFSFFLVSGLLIFSLSNTWANLLNPAALVQGSEQTSPPPKASPGLELDSKLDELKARKDNLLKRLESLKEILEGKSITYESFPGFDSIKKYYRLDQVKEDLIKLETSQIQFKQELDSLIGKEQSLQERRLNLPSLGQEILKRINQLKTEQPPLIEDPVLKEKSIKIKQLELENLELEQSAIEKEMLGFEKQKEEFKQRRESIQAYLSRLGKRLTELRATEEALRETEAALAKEQAEKALQKAKSEHPILLEVLKENSLLAQRRSLLATEELKLESIRQSQLKVDEDSTVLTRDFDLLRRKIKAVGMTPVIGLLLRKQRDNLPSITSYESLRSKNLKEISLLELNSLELQEQLSRFTNFPRLLQSFSPGLSNLSSYESSKILHSLEKALREQKKHMEEIQSRLNQALHLRADLESAYVQYQDLLRKVQKYVDENILFVRSDKIFSPAELMKSLKNPGETFVISDWKSTLVGTRDKALSQPVELILFLMLIIFLFFLKSQLFITVNAINEKLKSGQNLSFELTIRSLLFVFLRSLPWPIICIFLSYLFDLSSPNDLSAALSKGFSRVSYFILILEFVACLLRPKGMGETHFLWKPQATEILLKSLNFHRWFLLTAFLLFYLTGDLGPGIARDSLNRLFFVIYLAILIRSLFKCFHPNRSWLQDTFKRDSKRLLARLRWLWFPILIGMPFALCVISLYGYHYTAYQLTLRLHYTFLLILILILARAVIFRLLFNLRRAWWNEKKKADSTDSEETLSLDNSEVRDQIQRFLRNTSTLLFLSGLWLIWSEILPALNVLKKVEIWSMSSGLHAANGDMILHSVTLADFLVSLFILALGFIAVRNLPALLEVSVLRKLDLEPAQSYAIISIFRYLLILVGVLLCCTNLGISWANVQWLAAAFTVGLGFGLQEIFANFVAGLIILFEQPIRVKDIVTIGNVSGRITKIQIRATTILDFDNKELVVPNKEFITGQLINWTLTDPVLRLVLPVGVSYKADMLKVKKLLWEVIEECPTVIKEERTMVLFKQFGDSSCNFDVRVFIDNLDNYSVTWDDMYTRIFIKFKENDIEIPFPQRDIHLKNSDWIENAIKDLRNE